MDDFKEAIKKSKDGALLNLYVMTKVNPPVFPADFLGLEYKIVMVDNITKFGIERYQ